MARSNVRRLKQNEANDEIETLHERLSKPFLLPGEDADLYEAMASAIRKQLAPQGILQHLACEDVINLRWEILRHRVFRKRSAERWYAGRVYEIYSSSDMKMPSGRKISDDDKVRLAQGIVSEDADRRAASEQVFDQQAAVDREIILADAYAWAPTVKAHDARLNMLMRQHRTAMQDYFSLRAMDDSANVPDAELVEGAA